MPIHPHYCDACRSGYEVITTLVTAEPDPACPTCGRAGERRIGLPSVKTDSFAPGTPLDGGQFHDRVRDAYAGATDTAGKRYMHSIAAFPGDPEAWVSDMAEAKAVVRRRGWSAPELGIRAEAGPPAQIAPVAADIVAEELGRQVRAGEIAPPDKLTVAQRREAIDRTRAAMSPDPAIVKAFNAAKPKPTRRKKASAA